VPVTDLIRPTVRAIRWGGLVGSTIPATYLVWHVHNQPYHSAASTGTGLRVAAIMTAAGLAFTTDDPTEDTTGCAPISILMRRALRIALAFPIALVFWLMLRTYAVSALSTLEETLPTASLIIEFTMFAFIAYAGAAIGSRILSDRLGGLAGAGAVMITAVGLVLFPWGAGVLTRTPGTPSADEVEIWWLMILVAAVLTWWRLSLPPGLGAWAPRPHSRLPRPSRRPT
jgi:hypothetical protein